MNKPRGPVARPTHPAWTAFVVHTGTPESGWCPVCKAWTLLTSGLLLLTPDGVSALGDRTWCEICDDPDGPLPPRRTEHA